ncbi:MAG: 50S ribosomal protein L20 [Chloroflexi bacterium]|nr:50S ribosomal protein L20 [Chloroflexota bacterium]
MTRARNVPARRARRRRVLEKTSGQAGRRHRTFRVANEAMLHSLRYQWAHRRLRKRDFRRLWITRINAAARLNGLTYARLMNGLRLAGVEIDRKILADLAVREPQAFSRLADRARAQLA